MLKPAPIFTPLLLIVAAEAVLMKLIVPVVPVVQEPVKEIPCPEPPEELLVPLSSMLPVPLVIGFVEERKIPLLVNA